MHKTPFLTFGLVAFLLFAFAPSTCQAKEEKSQKKFELQYKFQLGEVLRYRVKHSSHNRSTIEGTTQEVESQSESVKAWKVTDVLPNGEIEFVHLVEQVKMSNRVPNRALRKFDSEKDKTPPPGFEEVAGSVGVPLSLIRMTSSGKIVHREEKHPQPPVGEDMPITISLPAEPVAIGEKWDATYQVPAERENGTKLKVRTRRVFTLESVKTGVATINVEYQILTPVSPFIKSQFVDRPAKGKVRFDIKKGRVLSQRFEADRRLIGFSGETSSMHDVSTLEERLLNSRDRLARKSK